MIWFLIWNTDFSNFSTADIAPESSYWSHLRGWAKGTNPSTSSSSSSSLNCIVPIIPFLTFSTYWYGSVYISCCICVNFETKVFWNLVFSHIFWRREKNKWRAIFSLRWSFINPIGLQQVEIGFVTFKFMKDKKQRGGSKKHMKLEWIGANLDSVVKNFTQRGKEI